jgi:hypothetical protein
VPIEAAPPAFQTIDDRRALDRRRSSAEIIAAARAEFPHFSDLIETMWR